MIGVLADTHSLVWYLAGDGRLSLVARTRMDAEAAAGREIGVSSVSIAELVYLTERSRVPYEWLVSAMAVLDDPMSPFLDVPLDRSLAETMQRVSRVQVPDFPDRIICATALHLGVPLISRDRRIIASNVQTLW